MCRILFLLRVLVSQQKQQRRRRRWRKRIAKKQSLSRKNYFVCPERIKDQTRFTKEKSNL
jgi:hypothetical protein